jgi:hypothetical protein
MSYDYKLITKRYGVSYSSVPAWSVIGLGTVDLADRPGPEYMENLIKVEFSYGVTNTVEYLSAELHVLVSMTPFGPQYIPSTTGGTCGNQADYPIGTLGDNRLYSHLMYPDNSNFFNYFVIFFDTPTPHPQLSDYWQMSIFAITPNYAGHCGAVITTYYPSHLPSNHDY